MKTLQICTSFSSISHTIQDITFVFLMKQNDIREVRSEHTYPKSNTIAAAACQCSPILNNKAMLSQGELHNAAVNFNTY